MRPRRARCSQLRRRPRPAGRRRGADPAPVPRRCDQPLQPHAAPARAALGAVQPAPARPGRRADRLPVRRQRLADAPQKLRPGRYYAVVSVRGASAGLFTLERESRTITRTAVYFLGASARRGRASVPAGRVTPIDVRVSPAATGRVTVEVERFDPVFGWQFYRQLRAPLQAGTASIPFTAPAWGAGARMRPTAARACRARAGRLQLPARELKLAGLALVAGPATAPRSHPSHPAELILATNPAGSPSCPVRRRAPPAAARAGGAYSRSSRWATASTTSGSQVGSAVYARE